MYKFFMILFLVTNFSWSQDQFSVYFASDKYELSKEEITKLIQWTEDNKNSKIIGAHGFCDEDGSIKYNDVLSEKRIDFVYNIIKDKINIRDDFRTRAFGELHKHDLVKAKNRKVTLYFLKEKELYRESELVGEKPKNETLKKVEKPKEPIVFPNKITVKNPNGTKSRFWLDVSFMKSLSEAKVGEKIRIKNLNFVLNTPVIVKKSIPRLYELLLVMQKYPRLKISIQGHLCCIVTNDRDLNDLTTRRAQVIYEFLEENGIDKKRMSYKGYGSTRPLHPIPEQNEKERLENRRVEIEVIEN